MTCPGCNAPLADTHRCYDPADRVRARQAAADAEALVAVVRPSGQAMFHTQDCAHAKRAVRTLLVLPSDFASGDVWCSACHPGRGAA